MEQGKSITSYQGQYYKIYYDHLIRESGSSYMKGPSCLWSYGSWIYNYICNQCLSPLTLWVRILIRASVQHYVIKFFSNLQQVGGFFFPGMLVFSTNKTDRHDITEILLKMALNTIKHQTNHILYKSCELHSHSWWG